MSNVVEEAMKAATIDYSVKGTKKKPDGADAPSAGKDAKDAGTASKSPDLSAPVKDKLKGYTPERFIKEEKDDIKFFIQQMRDITNDVETACKTSDPLEALVLFKKLEKEVVEKMAKALVPYANNQYATGNFESTLAEIKKYTPRRKWEYSKQLTSEMKQLDAKKKIEQNSGDAIDVSPPVDACSSKIFAISLKK